MSQDGWFHIQAACLWGQNPGENTKTMNVLITSLFQVHTIIIGSTVNQVVLSLEPGRSIILLCHSLILLWQKKMERALLSCTAANECHGCNLIYRALTQLSTSNVH